ncbi:retrovirus-related pol polyprotein from transposon TNT 1-94 [Tanacetum coccineum]
MVGFGGDDEGDDDGMMRVVALLLWLPDGEGRRRVEESVYGDRRAGEVYVTQPEGFVDADHPAHVFRLKKALYGLKQAPKAWYDLLSKFLLSQQFVKGAGDPNLFSLKEGEHIILMLNMQVAKTQGKIRSQLTDYEFDYTKIPLYCDSQSAIALSCNTVRHSWTKHIAVKYHFIKEQVENEIVELYFVKTAYQLADIFTKALAREHFEFLVKRLCMQSIMPKELKHLVESDEDEQ